MGQNQNDFNQYLEKLSTNPLILDRSDEEKDISAKQMKEKLLIIKIKRWGQGIIICLSLVLLFCFAWFLIHKNLCFVE